MIGGHSRLSDDDVAMALLIRRFEELTLRLVADGRIHGTTHTCLGQEYIPVAMQGLKVAGDYVLSNHRGHGHFLAHSGDPEGLMAELLGVEGAVSHGIGGSQHLHSPYYYSTGVQGQNVAIGTGIALRYKRDRRRNLITVYIGDGTWGEGSVYEALNMAALWELPLVVVVENNGIAQSTPTTMQMSGSIEERARAFGMPFIGIDDSDINRIRELLSAPMQHSRDATSPLVIEFQTTRLGPHSKGDDTRDDETLARLRTDDWFVRYTERYQDQVSRIGTEVEKRISTMMSDIEQRSLVRWRDES